MAKDYPIPMCGGCELRPTDPDTRQKVAGRLNVGERLLPNGTLAAVVYSREDPRIHRQYVFPQGTTADEAIRKANACDTSPEGLLAGIGDTEKLISDQRAATAQRVCHVTSLLIADTTLPPGLLHQTPRG